MNKTEHKNAPLINVTLATTTNHIFFIIVDFIIWDILSTVN